MIIARTPFRVSFFGGGTDFPEHYREHGGAVLLTAIDKFCYISIHHLAPFFAHRFRASYARTESVQSPSEFQHPLLRECLTMLDVKTGLEISHVADLPGRTGLGTSSSFTVGLLHALHVFRGDRVTARQLAEEAVTVERERVGDAGGHQDQYAAAFGGFARIDFSAGGIEVTPVEIETPRLLDLEERLLMFYMGVEQSAESILRDQSSKVKRNTAALDEMRAMVDAGEEILRGRGDLDAFGDLLHLGWERKRGLAQGITNRDIDEAYETARRAGARGGKLLGAGGRGFLLLYAEPGRHRLVREKLSQLREVDFRLAAPGSEIIFRTPS